MCVCARVCRSESEYPFLESWASQICFLFRLWNLDSDDKNWQELGTKCSIFRGVASEFAGGLVFFSTVVILKAHHIIGKKHRNTAWKTQYREKAVTSLLSNSNCQEMGHILQYPCASCWILIWGHIIIASACALACNTVCNPPLSQGQIVLWTLKNTCPPSPPIDQQQVFPSTSTNPAGCGFELWQR